MPVVPALTAPPPTASTALDTITNQVRILLRDPGTTFSTQITGDGSTKRYKLPIEFIEPGYSLAVPIAIAGPIATYLGPTVGLTSPADYSLDYEHGFLTLSVASLNNRVLEVDGYSWLKFSTASVQQFVNTAALQHMHNRRDKFNAPLTLDTLPVVEQYLVAVLAVIQGLWVLATESSGEVDVVIPDGISIPRTERFRQYLQIIEAWQARYNELAQLLNVGLHSIEMFDLRRVSLATGRLVPIYKDREYNQPNSPFYPTNAPIGSVVTIRGSFLLGTTAVTVNGIAAAFTVGDDNTITFTVPVGATTGPIAITTPGGVVTTTTSLQVNVQPPLLTYGPQQVFPAIDALDTSPGNSPSYASGYLGP